MEDAVVLSGTKIESQYRLGPHADADNGHKNEHHEPVDDAIGSHGRHASIKLDFHIEHDHDSRSGQLHHKGGTTYFDNIEYTMQPGTQILPPQLQHSRAPDKIPGNPECRHGLCQYRRQRRSADSPLEGEHKQVIQNDINDTGDNLCLQRRPGIALGADDIIDAKADVLEHTAQEMKSWA